MLRQIQNSTNLSYPIGDTFAIKIEASSGSFSDGSTLELIIAPDKESEPVIDNTYSLTNGVFNVNLSENDKKALTIGEYLYKLILKGTDGSVYTQTSGNLYVTWEA